jgi:hypothetical protein
MENVIASVVATFTVTGETMQAAVVLDARWRD